MAWLSHLPQIVSSALAATLRSASFSAGDLGPGGRDVTRLSASSPEMWSAICLANRAPISDAMAQLEEQLARLRTALHREDRQEILGFFRAGRDWLS
jgi:prephenate dehydrogenase